MQIKNLLIPFLFISTSFSSNINTLINEAIKNNYKIKSYNYQIESKNYSIEKSKSDYFPSINLYSSATYEKYKEVYPNGNKYNTEDKYVTYGISIKQNIFNKTIYPNIKDAKLQKEVTKLEKENFLLSLKKEIIYTYFQILITKENIKYKKKKKENSFKILQEIESKYKYHFATKTDLAQAKSNYTSAENDLIKTQTIYENLITKLKILLLTNKPININGRIKYDISEIFDAISLKDKEKIVNNPSFKEQKIYIDMAKNNINKNRSLNYPTIDLSGNIYQIDKDKGIDEKNHITVSLNLNWNLYSGSKIKNSIKEAKALYLSALNDFKYQKTVLDLDFNENWTNFQNSKHILQSDKETINKTEEYLLKAEESLKYKTISLTDFYSAQNQYFEALVNYNNDKLNSISYFLNLLKDTNEIEEKMKVLNNLVIN